jgi:hypothetical protein
VSDSSPIKLSSGRRGRQACRDTGLPLARLGALLHWARGRPSGETAAMRSHAVVKEAVDAPRDHRIMSLTRRFRSSDLTAVRHAASKSHGCHSPRTMLMKQVSRPVDGLDPIVPPKGEQVGRTRRKTCSRADPRFVCPYMGTTPNHVWAIRVHYGLRPVTAAQTKIAKAIVEQQRREAARKASR